MDYFEAHEEKKKDLADLNKRRDTDLALVTSYEYEMLDANNEKIKSLIHVTMNRLRVFKTYVLASLDKADEKVVVESDDESVDTAIIENFIRYGFNSANLKLITGGGYKLEPFFDEQACMTGEVAALVLFEMIQAKGETESYLNTDITPWDARYITYEKGAEGLAWGAYEVKMSKGVIESEKWAIKNKFEITGKSAKVLNIWASDRNYVYVDGKLKFEQENPYGFVPICVQKVPIGTMMTGKDSLLYQGESIFFLVRDIIKEYNRCLSVLQSLNLLAVKPPLKQKKKGGGKASKHEDLAGLGTTVVMEPDEDVQRVDFGDAQRSMVFALREINKALDDGTLNRIMLGDIPGDMSAVALIQVEQGQGQVYMPRLGTRGLLKKQIAQMFIKQTLAMESSQIEVGTPGHKKTFKTKDIEGEYEIQFKYANKSPETDFARLSLARQYKDSDLMPELTILADVMKRDDPEGDLMELHRQRLRRIVPALRIYDGLLSLATIYEKGDETAGPEIDITETFLNVSLDQLESGNIPQAEPEPTPGEPIIPAIGGGRSSAQKAADLQRTPGEEEE